MLASCVWTGMNWLLRRSPASNSEAPFLDGYGWWMLITVGGGLIGFLALIELLGFSAAILIFLVPILGMSAFAQPGVVLRYGLSILAACALVLLGGAATRVVAHRMTAQAA